MQLERVFTVPMRRFLFQRRRNVDNLNGPERAFLDANAASNAQRLGDERNGRRRRHDNALLPGPHYRARLFALA